MLFTLKWKSNSKGTALILVMAVVMLLGGLTMSLLMELSSRSDRTEADSEDVKSFEAAEAGLDAAIANLNMGGNGCLGIGWYGSDRTEEGLSTVDTDLDGFPDSDEVAAGGWHGGIDNVNYSAEGYTPPPGAVKYDEIERKEGSVLKKYHVARPQPREFDFYTHAMFFGDIRYYTYAIPWNKDGIDNDSNGTTDGDGDTDPDEQDWYTVYATGFSSHYSEKFSSNANNPLGRFTTVEAIVKKLESEFTVPAALTVVIAPFDEAE